MFFFSIAYTMQFSDTTTHLHLMKKTFSYNFLPTKEEEEQARARGLPHHVTRTLVEIRDLNPPPQTNPSNPWQIRKCVSTNEALTGMLTLSHQEMFDHVFRYWTMEMCNHVLTGKQLSNVMIVDYTDHEKVQSEKVFVKGEGNDIYVLGWKDDAQRRILLGPGDEIGLSWDVMSASFGFKVLRRAGAPRNQ